MLGIFVSIVGALALAVGIPAGSAQAQADWPAKPVRIVVPFAPGGTTDITARVIAEQLTRALKQNFVVENKAGAGGNIGAAEVARSAPDGYTFLMGTPGTQAINQFLYPQMPYDTGKDLIPVSFVVRVPNVLVVHPSVKARSVKELLELARARPGALNYGSPGNGTTGHLSNELLKNMAGVSVTHLPYRGSGPMLQDLAAGNLDLAIDNLPSAMGFIKSGRLIALGVTSSESNPALPEVPPISRTLPGYSAESWFVLVAPNGTPAPIVDRMAAEVDRILKRPEVVERFAGLGATPVGGTPADLGRFIAAETAKWQSVVKASGVKIQ